jgi:hypothetical protein
MTLVGGDVLADLKRAYDVNAAVEGQLLCSVQPAEGCPNFNKVALGTYRSSFLSLAGKPWPIAWSGNRLSIDLDEQDNSPSTKKLTLRVDFSADGYTVLSASFYWSIIYHSQNRQYEEEFALADLRLSRKTVYTTETEYIYEVEGLDVPNHVSSVRKSEKLNGVTILSMNRLDWSSTVRIPRIYVTVAAKNQ